MPRRVAPPGAQPFFMLEFDDGYPLAVVSEKAFVRNVARHSAGERGHAIDQGDVFVSKSRFQARAKHDDKHHNIVRPDGKMSFCRKFTEFPLLPNRGLGPLAMTVLPVPLARRAAATACAAVQSTAPFRRWR